MELTDGISGLLDWDCRSALCSRVWKVNITESESLNQWIFLRKSPWRSWNKEKSLQSMEYRMIPMKTRWWSQGCKKHISEVQRLLISLKNCLIRMNSKGGFHERRDVCALFQSLSHYTSCKLSSCGRWLSPNMIGNLIAREVQQHNSTTEKAGLAELGV